MEQFKSFNDYFSSLGGEWILTRSVSSGETLEGALEFISIDQSAFRVVEVGELRISDGNLISATRQWIWKFSDDGLQIFFDEEPLRLYHQLRPTESGGTWTAEGYHDCAPDIYSGEYRFSLNKITIRQDVMGPRKDYQIISNYSRKVPIRN